MKAFKPYVPNNGDNFQKVIDISLSSKVIQPKAIKSEILTFKPNSTISSKPVAKDDSKVLTLKSSSPAVQNSIDALTLSKLLLANANQSQISKLSNLNSLVQILMSSKMGNSQPLLFHN